MKKINQHNLILRGGRARRGSTLVELSVVLMVMAIVAVMIVSFTALVAGYADDSRVKYEFLEDVSTIKTELTAYVNEVATSETALTVQEHELAIATANIKFENYTLLLGSRSVTELNSVSWLEFDLDDDLRLIKCTAVFVMKGGKMLTTDFVFAPMAGSIKQGVAQ